ncbi:MAG: cellulase family glycosylhydrolase [Lachnospiraceae bacterium]
MLEEFRPYNEVRRAGGEGLRLEIKNKCLIDEYGRERIFNGINMVYKGTEDASVPGGRRYTREYDAKEFQALKAKGINLVRLGIVWDAIEHEMGAYDDRYLSWIENILDNCSKNQIAVFLDMHQDLYSRAFDGGAPLWATLTDGADHIKGDLWSDAYLYSDAVHTAYQNFWKNKKTEAGIGLLDHYAELWKHVIQRVGTHEAVIGYDFINEPFSGEMRLKSWAECL